MQSVRLQLGVNQADVVGSGRRQRRGDVEAQLSRIGLRFDRGKSDVLHRRGILPQEQLLDQCLDLLVVNRLRPPDVGARRGFSNC